MSAAPIRFQNSKMHILLADDDEDDRSFFQEAINDLDMNHKLTVFSDGVELMDYLRTTPSDDVHILFLDLNMPCKKGLECLHEIRADAKLKNLSVAIYSTSSNEKDIEEAFVAGANVYIKKPNDFQELKKIVRAVTNVNWQYHTSGLSKETFLFSL